MHRRFRNYGKRQEETWEDFLDPSKVVSIRATCHRSKLYHSKGVMERVSGAINNRLGEVMQSQTSNASDDSTPDQLIIVRISNDECLISVDTSGEALHRRGYQIANSKGSLEGKPGSSHHPVIWLGSTKSIP